MVCGGKAVAVAAMEQCEFPFDDDPFVADSRVLKRCPLPCWRGTLRATRQHTSCLDAAPSPRRCPVAGDSTSSGHIEESRFAKVGGRSRCIVPFLSPAALVERLINCG